MGFFTFLTGQQAEEQEGQPNPEGWRVRRKGKDYWENNPDTPAGPEDEIDRQDQTPMGVEGVDYDVSKTKARKAHSEIQSAYGEALKVLKAMPEDRNLGADPEGAAFGLGQNSDRSDLEAALTRAQGRENPIKLADDLRVIASRKTIDPQYAKLLFGAADKLTKAYSAQGELEAMRQPGQPLAVTPQEVEGRGKYLAGEIQKRQEALKTAGSLRAPQLQEELKRLREEEGRVSLVNKAKEQAENPAPPVTDRPVTHFFKGLGIDEQALTGKMHAALYAVGIPSDQWGDTNVDPSAGLMRVLGQMDPQGAFAQLIVQQLSLAKQEDLAQSQHKGAQESGAPSQGEGQPEDPGLARTQQAISGKEAELRQLYSQLRESPFMRTWPGIILYFLVGILTQNPAFAARLVGGVGNRDGVNAEIRGLQWELRRLDHQLEWRERNDSLMKREAARRLTNKQDEADQRKWELSKMGIQHNLILQRNAARGNPETAIMKKLASNFQRSLGMASKFQGTMQNEFADPKDRSEAKRNFDYYMKQAASLDAQIRDMGGAVMDEGGEPEE